MKCPACSFLLLLAVLTCGKRSLTSLTEEEALEIMDMVGEKCDTDADSLVLESKKQCIEGGDTATPKLCCQSMYMAKWDENLAFTQTYWSDKGFWASHLAGKETHRRRWMRCSKWSLCEKDCVPGEILNCQGMLDTCASMKCSTGHAPICGHCPGSDGKAMCGNPCSKDTDCGSGYTCGGDALCSVGNIGCGGGLCIPKSKPGEIASCESHCTTGKMNGCHVCLETGKSAAPDGSLCERNSDCLSDWCEGGGWDYPGVSRSFWSAFGIKPQCDKKCEPKLPDGAKLVIQGYPLPATDVDGKTYMSWYDYNQCQSRTGTCGTCTSTSYILQLGDTCQHNVNCPIGQIGRGCCKGNAVGAATADCTGTCVEATEANCPSTMSGQVKKMAVDSLKLGANTFQCVANAQVEQKKQEALDQLPCTADYQQSGVFTVLCPRVGYEGNLLEKAHWSTKDTVSLACFSNKNCNAGAQLSYFFETGFNFPVAASPSTVTVDSNAGTIAAKLKVTYEAKAGFAVVVGGACEYTKEVSYPKIPKVIFKACVKVVCLAVLLQGSMEVTVRGSMSAKVGATFTAIYEAGIDVKLKLADIIDNPLEASKAIEHSVSLTKKSFGIDQYSIEGVMNAGVSVRFGPRISVVLLPGAPVTFFVYGKADLQAYGEYSAGETAASASTLIEWPSEIKCTTSDKTSEKASQRRRSTKFTNKTQTTSGANISIPIAEGYGTCAAAGFTLDAGVEIGGMGTPPSTDMGQVIKEMCLELKDAVTGTSQTATDLSKCLQDNNIGPGAYFDAICTAAGDLVPDFSFLSFLDSMIGCTEVAITDFGSTECPGCRCNVGCASFDVDEVKKCRDAAADPSSLICKPFLSTDDPPSDKWLGFSSIEKQCAHHRHTAALAVGSADDINWNRTERCHDTLKQGNGLTTVLGAKPTAKPKTGTANGAPRAFATEVSWLLAWSYGLHLAASTAF